MLFKIPKATKIKVWGAALRSPNKKGGENVANSILEMKNITKKFPGVIALDDVSFRVNEGEVHALVGENGAGKSTLMKILNGVYTADAGEVLINGKTVSINNPLDAQKNGLSIIFQEFNLVPSLSVAENIYIGRLLNKNKKLIDWKDINVKAAELLKKLNYDLDPQNTDRKFKRGTNADDGNSQSHVF